MEQFLTDIEKKKQLDGQSFWQTREFYSPGSFRYNHDGFSPQDIEPLLKKMNLEMKDIKATIPFLTYKSDKWISAEFLVNNSDISSNLTIMPFNNNAILQTPTSWIYFEDENTLKIIFTKNIDEMQNANGFFDYPGHDKEYLKDKYWLSISTVDL